MAIPKNTSLLRVLTEMTPVNQIASSSACNSSLLTIQTSRWQAACAYHRLPEIVKPSIFGSYVHSSLLQFMGPPPQALYVDLRCLQFKVKTISLHHKGLPHTRKVREALRISLCSKSKQIHLRYHSGKYKAVLTSTRRFNRRLLRSNVRRVSNSLLADMS